MEETKEKKVKKVKPSVQEEVRTHLTEYEMSRFEMHEEKEKRRKLETELMLYKKKAKELSVQIYQKEILVIEKEMLLLVNEHSAEKSRHKEFTANLIKELGVTQLAFDPQTGEINRQ